MDLTSKQRRHLRALAHHLNPVVMVGNAGVTDGVAEAVDVALTRHELIKVRVDADAPEDRHEVADALTTRLRASEVQVIGHVVVLYRRHPPEPQIALPDLPAAAAPKDPKRLPASRTRVEEPPARPLHRPRGRFNPARGRRSGS
jgi:RNA-binding protein